MSEPELDPLAQTICKILTFDPEFSQKNSNRIDLYVNINLVSPHWFTLHSLTLSMNLFRFSWTVAGTKNLISV